METGREEGTSLCITPNENAKSNFITIQGKHDNLAYNIVVMVTS